MADQQQPGGTSACMASHPGSGTEAPGRAGRVAEATSPKWWQTSVVYEIYPRSFADSNGDGIGDLEGVRRHLDHLAWLGIDAVWLSPFFRSPMADFGYDVSDYTDVDPLFGTLADFDRLLEEAHDRGMKVLVDWVPNHTSDQHPWFVEARASRTSPKRDWYVWRDGDPQVVPNNWQAGFGGDAWTWDKATGQWYLHLFLAEQPDLNWRNPEVVAAMHDTLRFWLDRGVDGFRVDVVHAIAKDPSLPDAPAEFAGIPYAAFLDHPDVHPMLREIRDVLDGYPGDRMLVGEAQYLGTTEVIASLYGSPADGAGELHLVFNFQPLLAPWDAAAWRAQIDLVVGHLGPRDAWPVWVLSNHDVVRHRSRYGSEARARAAAVLLLTLRGTPFLYAGEELGLEQARVPKDRRVDPGGRDGCRAPVPWDPSPTHGWATTDPWLPWPPDADACNAETLRADERSILHLYRDLLAARRASAALHAGGFELLEAPEGVLTWRRTAGDDQRVVAVNFTSEPQSLPTPDGGWTVEISSDRVGEGSLAPRQLAADTAVVLRPASTPPASTPPA